MGRLVNVISFGFLAVLAFLFAQLYLPRGLGEGEDASAAPGYHVKIIINETETFFAHQFALGAAQAEEDYDLFVEFENLERWDYLPDSLRISILSGVDAVAFQSNDPDMALAMNELAQENGVELMLYESENTQNVSVLAAGSNSYSTGTEAGHLALRATGGNCEAIVIVERTQGDLPAPHVNMKVQGITEAFSEYDDAVIVEILQVGSGVMDGENVAKTLLSLRNTYNTIICLHEKTTPLIAQRLIDNSLVGSIELIGYGALPQTLEYIDRGVIYGTVSPDAYEVGYNTVALMYAKLNQEQVNDYSSTRLFTITADNVQQFSETGSGAE